MKKYQQIITELEKELSKDLIATRPTQWGEVSYIESHHAIRQANRIFGYGSWERVITIPPTKINDGYMAAVKVTVHLPDENGHIRTAIHEDVGYRKITKEGLEETAIKGSVSDALKRCLRAFGAQFGLDLYGHEESEDEEAKPIRKANGNPFDRRVKALISSVTKTAGEAKWPYEVEFMTEDSPLETLPAYVHKLDQILRPNDEVVLIITTSKAGNEYIKAVEPVEEE
jgi:hypothetical protein